MSFKILGQLDGTTNNQTLYTVPADKESIVNIAIANRSQASGTFSLAVSATDVPTDAEWINFEEAIPGNNPYERTGICMQAGKRIVVKFSVAGFSVSAWGSEGDVN